MLALQANQELERTYQKVIQAMDARVAWEGRFLITGDQLILEGKVRSLVFQFETKMVLVDLIDLAVNENRVIDIEKHPKLQDLINMILYAFGKWRTLRGLRVEQDYAQLNQLFERVLRPYYIEPSFRRENLRFYKEGVRITYEEVLDIALESEERPQEEPEDWAQAEAQGLWHTLIWKKQHREFRKVETTLAERQDDRIGNNFYLVGYLCPKCGQKMHMVVYPANKEQRIDTNEKGVFIARAYTCRHCHSFYTPCPNRLLAEGEVYEMCFDDDEKAYEDYLELLGQNGDRTANFKYSEYEAFYKKRLHQDEQPDRVRNVSGSWDELEALDEPEAFKQLESFVSNFEHMPDDVFRRFTYRIEDGFYPDAAVARHEQAIQVQQQKRQDEAFKKAEQNTGKDRSKGDTSQQPGSSKSALLEQNTPAKKHAKDKSKAAYDGQVEVISKEVISKEVIPKEVIPKEVMSKAGVSAKGSYKMPGVNQDSKAASMTKNSSASRQAGAGTQAQASAQTGNGTEIEKYQARLGVLKRLSDRQRTELKRQIIHDPALDVSQKQALIAPIEQLYIEEQTAAAFKKADGLEKRNYAQIQKAIQDLDKEELPAEVKKELFDKLDQMLLQRGEQEVRNLIEKIPERLDWAAYQALEKKLHSYEKVDLSPYQETMRQKQDAAQKQEIANMVKRARKRSRQDLVSLMQRLEGQGFLDATLSPYMEKIKEKLYELDSKKLDEICDHVQDMDFGQAADAYEKIDQGNFLPELKNNAMELLQKRLQKIRTDECELLVHKLQDEMRGKIHYNERHHFYPARKVMLKTAQPSEINAIHTACNTYAADRSMFEYPILVADTSRHNSGREGMMLTPENLFYGTKMSSYEIPVTSIASITATTGLLNRKITLEETNGAKHKLPYVVKTDEMTDWAQILDTFIQYLQEKPASRKLAYLAKETHETICCYRCGYVYQGSAVCPECGYKKNR